MTSKHIKNPEVRRLRATLGAAVRDGHRERAREVRRALKVELMRDAINELVSTAPLPTREQREELIGLLQAAPKRRRNSD